MNFAERDTKTFRIGGQTMTGEDSDEALSAAIRKAGNVILLAEATFEGDHTRDYAWPDQGYRMSNPEATREALPDRYLFRSLGDVVVKGKTQPVAIFEVKENQAWNST